MKKPVIIGIAGGTASGKTSVAKVLANAYQDEGSILLISMDDYYKLQVGLTYEERCKTNYDHPFAFDMDLMISQIDDLCQGKEVLKPTYDFPNHNRSDIVEKVKPADVIILDGLFILEDEQLRSRLNMKIYVDTDDDVRFIRRLQRDVKERGRTIESVCNQYLTTVKPMHDLFIEPSKKYADVIVPGGVENAVAMDLLLTKIETIIHQNK